MKLNIVTLLIVMLESSEGLLPLSNQNHVKIRMNQKCPSQCPRQESPVCGSDGNSYDNVCKMIQSTCRTGSDVGLSHVGRCGVPAPCPAFCPTRDELEFCGDDGVTYQSMCHVLSAACRGYGPTFVSEGPCQLFRNSENFLEDLSYIPDMFRYNGTYLNLNFQ